MRETVCHRCRADLSEATHERCRSCGWLRCDECGACSPRCSGDTGPTRTGESEPEPVPLDPDAPGEPRCYGCGRRGSDVRRLVFLGPDDERSIGLCVDCIKQAYEIVTEN